MTESNIDKRALEICRAFREALGFGAQFTMSDYLAARRLAAEELKEGFAAEAVSQPSVAPQEGMPSKEANATQAAPAQEAPKPAKSSVAVTKPSVKVMQKHQQDIPKEETGTESDVSAFSILRSIEDPWN